MINDKGKGKKKKLSRQEQYMQMLKETSPRAGSTSSNRSINIPSNFTWPPEKKTSSKSNMVPAQGAKSFPGPGKDAIVPRSYKKGGSVKNKKK